MTRVKTFVKLNAGLRPGPPLAPVGHIEVAVLVFDEASVVWQIHGARGGLRGLPRVRPTAQENDAEKKQSTHGFENPLH